MFEFEKFYHCGLKKQARLWSYNISYANSYSFSFKGCALRQNFSKFRIEANGTLAHLTALWAVKKYPNS